MKWILLSFFCLTHLGCAQANKITRIESKNSVIKHKKDSEAFANLYSGKKSYPVTCEENCYPSSPVVKCETQAENCLYIGEQTKPNINAGFSIHWLGHASFSIKSPDGSHLLFDPVSQQFDWPVNWAFRLQAGFNRNEPTWLTKQEIERVDAVLYSHIHYDHFNKSDIHKIGNKPEYLVPLGFAEHFSENDFNITEMPWFSTKSLEQLNIHFVPAHHFSSRILVPYIYNDDDMTLWGGWVLEHHGQKLFFAGDTGYSKHFQDIQSKYGDMDICLIPIASYFHQEHSNWYRYVHTTPEDALTAAKELNCKVMIPWGYGNTSWKMGDKSSHSPLLRLLHMHKNMQSDITLHILNEGEKVSF